MINYTKYSALYIELLDIIDNYENPKNLSRPVVSL